MRDFLDDLDRQLAAIAHEQAELDARTTSPVRKTKRSRRRPAVLGGLTATIAAGLAGFALVGTSAADLPILDTPPTDASAARSSPTAAKAARLGVDFRKGHAFSTPDGPGYVVTNEETGTVCLLAPAPGQPGDYGVSCGTPLSTVERDGLYTEFVEDQAVTRDAKTTAVFVLPDGATDVRLRTGARETRPRLEYGVLVVAVRSDTRLSWSVDGRRATRTIAGPFKGTFGEQAITCGNGANVTVEIPPTKPGGAQPRIDKIVKKACDAAKP